MRWRGVAGKEGHSLTLNGALKLAVSLPAVSRLAARIFYKSSLVEPKFRLPK